MSAPTVTSVTAASPAARAGLAVGDELLSIDGHEPRDVIDFQRLSDGADLGVLVRRAGAPLPRLVRVDKAAGEPLGVEVSSAVFDRIRTCDNHCAFCFIYQLPKGMRRSLYLKDDDYRLSFLYGNFTTLTRFTELDAERILTERLGPLFVSIHATDPDAAGAHAAQPQGRDEPALAAVLLDGGIEVHGQVVVCPGVNDGAALEDTLAGILDRFPGLASVGAVPLGVSRYSNEPDMRPHTRRRGGRGRRDDRGVAGGVPAGARAAHGLRGRRVLPAGRAGLPRRRAATRASPSTRTGSAWRARSPRPSHGRPPRGPGGVRHGFFASVDAAPAEGYRAPRLPSRAGGRGRPAGDGADRAPTAPACSRRWWRRTGATDVAVRPVANDFFGGNIGVAGLLTGEDVGRALRAGARRAAAACCPTPA